MTTIRVAHRRRFAQIDRRTVNDPRISFKAKGLLLWLLDKPDDWWTTVERLAEVGPDGEYAVRKAVHELEDAGYIERRRERDGSRWKWEWVVHEVSRTAETAGGEPAETADRPEVKTADGDQVAQPAITAGSRETDENLTETKTAEGRSLSLAERPTTAFDAFWETYPRKVGKSAAYRKFNAALASGVDPTKIVEAARRYADDPNRDPQYTAHPTTWLNQGRWDDETPLPRSRIVTGGDLIRAARTMTDDEIGAAVGLTRPEGGWR